MTSEAAQRCLDEAQLILDEGLLVFGRRVRNGTADPWDVDPLTGRRWPHDRPWWRIDIRSDRRLSDVKLTWEAGRHRDLVVLARASRLDPEGEWLDALTHLLRSWVTQAAPEQGVHWHSSLELSLRAIAWSQILDLAGERLPHPLVRDLERLLFASARHLLFELPYAVSSMRNNHLLGDALGLITLARLFPDARGARRWARLGERLFLAQLRRHLRADGSMIEDSLSYHRFVLEMLSVRVLLGDAPVPVRRALHAASQHLRALGVFEGDVPQYGDWDEGRVLASSGDPLDVAGSAALGLALSGEAIPGAWYTDYDELAWYAPIQPIERPAPPPPAALSSGGIAHVRRGPWRVWFKVGSGPSHGHADLTSVWIAHRGRWLVCEPGTGTYNGPLDVRNGLRSSAAHPVQRPDGQDQLEPHRVFRWLRTAHGHLAAPLCLPDRTILFGWHDAYAPLRVGRAVVVHDTYVAVLEFADRPEQVRSWRLTVPLHPDVEVKEHALLRDGEMITLFGLDVRTAKKGELKPFAGWHSRTYGHWEPATWLSEDSRTLGAWGVGEAPPGTPFNWDGYRLEVRWAPRVATLLAVNETTGDRHELQARS
ncbi:heparinase II/III family protein [Micromonospora sp. NPDC049374]|uniref:heparinase II/III domain-containing protein n=1 Tax=Micromonospora sp. NPDC049374 TaxID=3154352 RepID=UPI0034420ACB